MQINNILPSFIAIDTIVAHSGDTREYTINLHRVFLSLYVLEIPLGKWLPLKINVTNTKSNFCEYRYSDKINRKRSMWRRLNYLFLVIFKLDIKYVTSLFQSKFSDIEILSY